MEHNLLGRTFKAGEDDFRAGSVATTWTHFGENNWYLDGVVQGTWYDMQMTSRRGLRDGDTDGFGFAASLEGGYPFQLGGGWLLEPQAQLVYQALDIDEFNDGPPTSVPEHNLLAGLIGARVAGTGTPAMKVQSGSSHCGAAPTSARIPRTRGRSPSAAGFIPFSVDPGDSWATLGIGAAMPVSDAASLYGNAESTSASMATAQVPGRAKSG